MLFAEGATGAPSALELQCQQEDRAVLSAAFQGSFDHSLAQTLVRGAGQGDDGDVLPHFIGAGVHFRTWLVPESAHQPMALALSVAHKQRREADNHWQGRWLRAMRQVQSFQLPLLPPFALVAAGDHVGWVRPYGSVDLSDLRECWRPLGKVVKHLENTLQYKGLAINDWLQVRVWNGIPFVCDLSDLRPA